jgi:hypothetical protein
MEILPFHTSFYVHSTFFGRIIKTPSGEEEVFLACLLAKLRGKVE